MPEAQRSRPAEANRAATSQEVNVRKGTADGFILPPTTDDGAPILSAYRTADGVQLASWCAHEHVWHRHGACCECEGDEDGDCICPVGTGDGHRGAHCRCQASPYARSGYVLREVGPWTEDLQRDYRELPYERSCRWQACRFGRDGTAQACADDECPLCPDCFNCGAGARCACYAELCHLCDSCPDHSDHHCAGCWLAHGGPGQALCDHHGWVYPCPAHQARVVDGSLVEGCTVGWCDGMPHYRRTEDEARGAGYTHRHCPQCWAEGTLAAYAIEGTTGYAPASCQSCRDLLTDADMDRVTQRANRFVRLMPEVNE